MYIQVLDYHDNQYIFYYDNKINIDTNLPSDATCTWNYNTFLKDCNLKFANIYVQGADSKDYCPESLAHHYDFYCTKIETYQNIYEKRKNAPNAKIIDEAYGSLIPVAPNKLLIRAASLLLGLFIPLMREMPEMMYQYDRDYVFNSDKFTNHFDFI